MNIKINILRAILIILLIVVFSIIFSFSSQDGEKSGSLSRRITQYVTKNIKLIQRLEETKKEQVLKKIEFYIRKLAHFSLYTVVGFLTMSLMSTYNLIQIKRMGYSLGSGVIYAISDELHQMFIANRTPSVVDICIDSCGVLFGIFIVTGVLKIISKLNLHKILKKY